MKTINRHHRKENYVHHGWQLLDLTHKRCEVEIRLYFNPRGHGRVYCCIWQRGDGWDGSAVSNDRIGAVEKATQDCQLPWERGHWIDYNLERIAKERGIENFLIVRSHP